MQRALIISIIVVAALVIIGGGYVLVTNRTTTSTTSNRTTTTSTTNVSTATTTPEELGQFPINQRLTYRGVEFHLSAVSKVDTFHGQRAPAGQQYVVVFTQPITTGVSEARDWIMTDATLTASSGVANALLQAQLVPAPSSDTGYLWFSTPTDQYNFRLVMSAEGQTQAAVPVGL